MHVELRGVGKTYDGRQWAVEGLDLDIPSRSIFGLIGPNGAGKSTTLRMIATLAEPSSGTIAFDDRMPTSERDHSELRRRIGFLGDGNPLYKDLTPAEYLRFFGECFGLRGKSLELAIADMLSTFGLETKTDTPAGKLSKGMRQRLLIARCMLHRPSLLILDEPADGLDPRGRSDLRQILRNIRERGTTIIVSSHILRELDDLCDQVAILQRGRVVVSGEITDIVDRYEVTRFVFSLRILAGIDTARRLVLEHRALIEDEGMLEGLPFLNIQVPGGEARMADLLSSLCVAGVKVVTASRVRSRLEDVYVRLSDDRVN